MHEFSLEKNCNNGTKKIFCDYSSLVIVSAAWGSLPSASLYCSRLANELRVTQTPIGFIQYLVEMQFKSLCMVGNC